MTREKLIEIHKEGTELIKEVVEAVKTGKITKLELLVMYPQLKELKEKQDLLVEKINSMNDIQYSIAKCDCCGEEYILETHINSKDEIVEEKPFDFTDVSPAELFKMGFDSCLKQD